MFDYVSVSPDELYRNKKPVFKGFGLGKPLETLIDDLHGICESLSCAEAVNEIFDSLQNDFTLTSPLYYSEYRFISSEEIDEIQQSELTYDEYVLGCFNASFLAGLDNMPLDYDTIKTMQESEAFEALGKIILSNSELLKELQADYVSADGYGHHFAGYDHEQHEVVIGDTLYYVFRTN